MTKEERLIQLKDQEQLYKVLDRYFDAGWREFVRGIQSQNQISNLRVFRILSKIKGNDFVADLIALMKVMKQKYAYLSFTKNPKGVIIKDNRTKSITELMVEKFQSGSYREGKIYIQVRPDRWVTFVF